jgi:hypothetical protein
MPLKAICNHIIFQFEDNIVTKHDHGKTRSQFSEETDWGFEISSYDEGTKTPRWGIVTSIGPAVEEDISIGSRILIEPLQWTEAVELEDGNYWRTDETKIIAIDESFQS